MKTGTKASFADKKVIPRLQICAVCISKAKQNICIKSGLCKEESSSDLQGFSLNIGVMGMLEGKYYQFVCGYGISVCSFVYTSCYVVYSGCSYDYYRHPRTQSLYLNCLRTRMMMK